MRNYNVLKQPVITKMAGERSKKAQSKEMLKSVAVSVSPKLEKITRYNKTNNRKIRERISRTENPKKTACVPKEKLSISFIFIFSFYHCLKHTRSFQQINILLTIFL